jgi:dihydrofolate reductase
LKCGFIVARFNFYRGKIVEGANWLALFGQSKGNYHFRSPLKSRANHFDVKIKDSLMGRNTWKWKEETKPVNAKRL